MSNLYWLMSGEAMQRRLLREIREARTPLTARAPAPRASEPRGPESLRISGDVATITVAGVLTPVADEMAAFYGEPNTTYPDLQAALAGALASDVREIVWEISSPGGSVDGYFALIDDIAGAKAAGANMRVVASEAQSAAYGIAAAVGHITATSRVASFGSVGVAVSGFVQGGLCGEVVDMTSSDAPEKRPNIKTPEGKAVVVKYLDQLADEFMTAIAAGRGVTAAQVAEGFGRGASMLAKQAKAAGLIDDIATRSPTYARTLTNAHTSGSVPKRMADAPAAVQAPEATAPEAAAPAVEIPVTLDTSAFAADLAELEQLRAERTARESAERRALITELVALRAEKPATAWANGAPVPRLANEPIASLRERVAALRDDAPAAATPPALGVGIGEEALEDFERRDAAKITDPAARARFVASRLERKQKAQ
jgi:ClpP class serine protease